MLMTWSEIMNQAYNYFSKIWKGKARIGKASHLSWIRVFNQGDSGRLDLHRLCSLQDPGIWLKGITGQDAIKKQHREEQKSEGFITGVSFMHSLLLTEEPTQGAICLHQCGIWVTTEEPGQQLGAKLTGRDQGQTRTFTDTQTWGQSVSKSLGLGFLWLSISRVTTVKSRSFLALGWVWLFCRYPTLTCLMTKPMELTASSL